MKVTQWGELGVLCTIEIAQGEASGSPSTSAADIASKLKIDIQYTQQVLHRLKRGGILKSIRGPKGGYTLTKLSNQLTLGDILRSAEGETFEVICETKPINSERCGPNQCCNLRPIWMRLREHINEFLGQVTLSDLLQHPVEDILVKISARREQSIATRSMN